LKTISIWLIFSPLQLTPNFVGHFEMLFFHISNHSSGGYIFSKLIDGGKHASAVELVLVRPFSVTTDSYILELSLNRVIHTCRMGLEGD
jgi:hypothetical protein